jgi:hypothetical protein
VVRCKIVRDITPCNVCTIIYFLILPIPFFSFSFLLLLFINTGKMYDEGKGCKVDEDAAFRMFKASFEKGHKEGRNHLGTFLFFFFLN